MKGLTPLSPVKIFTSGREVGPISQINLRAPFGGNTDVLRYGPTTNSKNSIDMKRSSRVEKFLVGPSTSNLVNIATCELTAYSAVGRYHTVMSRNNITGSASLFYTVGVVSHSDLVTGSKSHQICVVPSDLAWNRIAVVMGAIFELRLSTSLGNLSVNTGISMGNPQV